MKKCKKIALLILVFILSMTLNVYAADYANDPSTVTADITLTPSVTSVKVNETVTITLSASYENGIECVDSKLEYDETKLELTNIEMINYFDNQSGTDAVTGEYILTALYGDFGAPEDAPTQADYAKLSFKVLEAATVGETLSVKILETEVIDPNLKSTTVGDKEVTLTVIEEVKEENPGDGEQNPGDGEQNPSDGEQDTNKEEQKPTGGNQKPADTTIADKNINYAGLETYGFIVVIVAIVAIVFYKKYKKYKDIY